MTDGQPAMPPEPDRGQLLKLAMAVSREAGELIYERRTATERPEIAATKTSPTDVVTDSDLAAERLIRDRLLAARPDDAIIGEEGGATSGDSRVCWVVDPIDGTVNYLYGLPFYSVSIAAEVDGVVVAGAVFGPATDEMWTAVKGGGAFLNGQQVRESGCQELDQALVATGFSYEAEQRQHQADIVTRLLPRVRDIRRLGSAALDLCAVAGGRVDGYFEQGLNAWDMAAGALIAEEAGAVVRVVSQDAGQAFVLAAAPGVASTLFDLVQASG